MDRQAWLVMNLVTLCSFSRQFPIIAGNSHLGSLANVIMARPLLRVKGGYGAQPPHSSLSQFNASYAHNAKLGVIPEVSESPIFNSKQAAWSRKLRS